MAEENETLYLALDQGGHSSRALVFNQCGEMIARHQIDISTQRVGDDRVEHDGEELAQSLIDCCHQIAKQLGHKTSQIKSAGLATQRSSIIAWSGKKALSPVLSWQDTRAAGLINRKLHHSSKVEDVTGLVMSPHYGASKINWCLKNYPSIMQAQQTDSLTIGPLASFLIRALTVNSPEPVDNYCDPANASRTLLWDRRQCDWSPALCKMFGIDPQVLPVCTPSRYTFGQIQVGATEVPLTLVTGDQSAAIYAFGQPSSDTACINLGTGAFLQWPTGHHAIDIDGMLNSVVFQDEAGPHYVLEGTVNGAGSALTWWADKHSENSKVLLQRALQNKSGEFEPTIFLNGISGLGSPYWRSDFKSRFLSDEPTAEQGAIAILESIIFLLFINLRKIRSDDRPLHRIVLTGGLANVDYLCQGLADLAMTTVVRTDLREATATGVGYLLCESKTWPQLDNLEYFRKSQNSALEQRFEQWHQAMEQSLVT